MLLPAVTTASGSEMEIDDLLIPEITSLTEQLHDEMQFKDKSYEEKNIDDLLGPKDIFPFLPDNHRDSGTGKFNTY